MISVLIWVDHISSIMKGATFQSVVVRKVVIVGVIESFVQIVGWSAISCGIFLAVITFEPV